MVPCRRSLAVLISLSTSDEEEVVIVWAETGGPVVPGTPERMGYGSSIVERAVEWQLSGDMSFDWQATGLVVKLKVPRAELAK
jgi:two-component sensor histidine kinase